MNFRIPLPSPAFSGIFRASAILFATLSLWIVAPASAGDGHDHGSEKPAAAATASPRFDAHSDTFEVVGMLKGGELIVTVDRFATNEPVLNAKVELESGSTKALGKFTAETGDYRFAGAPFAKPANHPITLTITAGQDIDLLSGNLQITDPHAAHEHGHDSGWAVWGKWAGITGGAVGGLLVLATLVIAWQRRRQRTASVTAVIGTMAAVLIAAAASAIAPAALAGPGHDHGDAAPAATGDGPKREPDGRVFLPKLSQRQLAVRTILSTQVEHPRALELIGKVVTDPAAAGKVQPTVAGRVEAPKNGMPSLGQKVTRGELLVVIRPSAGVLERAQAGAQVAELRGQIGLAEKRLARAKALEGTVPQKEIDIAQAELQSAQARLSAVGGGLAASETLRAPVSGVIAVANVVAGQVVDAREVLFEIIDPARLRIEAILHDTTLVNSIESASASADGGKTALALDFISAGRMLKEQALPILFSLRTVAGNQPPSMILGQSVKLVALTRARINGVALPTRALVKNPANQDVVWVHSDAERFTPKAVRFETLDGATVAVTAGIKPGERVVVDGAPLINQVR